MTNYTYVKNVFVKTDALNSIRPLLSKIQKMAQNLEAIDSDRLNFNVTSVFEFSVRPVLFEGNLENVFNNLNVPKPLSDGTFDISDELMTEIQDELNTYNGDDKLMLLRANLYHNRLELLFRSYDLEDDNCEPYLFSLPIITKYEGISL